jgi:hypothetical protein
VGLGFRGWTVGRVRAGQQVLTPDGAAGAWIGAGRRCDGRASATATIGGGTGGRDRVRMTRPAPKSRRWLAPALVVVAVFGAFTGYRWAPWRETARRFPPPPASSPSPGTSDRPVRPSRPTRIGPSRAPALAGRPRSGRPRPARRSGTGRRPRRRSAGRGWSCRSRSGRRAVRRGRPVRRGGPALTGATSPCLARPPRAMSAGGTCRRGSIAQSARIPCPTAVAFRITVLEMLPNPPAHRTYEAGRPRRGRWFEVANHSGGGFSKTYSAMEGQGGRPLAPGCGDYSGR